MNFQKANSAHLPRARDQISTKYCMRVGCETMKFVYVA